MGNCKNCKHWDDGACRGDSESDIPPEDGFAVVAHVLDDSGLWVEFRTGPMFGCLKFTPANTTKETTP
jgi:hypothetical protein